MKTIHFDCSKNERKYLKKKNHLYIPENIQTYLKKKGQIDAEIVTGFVYSDFNEKVLKSIKNLKLVITRSAGMDNIDTRYCDLEGIKYKNVQYSSHNVAHHTMALILFFSRNLQSFEEVLKKGKFSDKEITCFDLKDKTLGIIGYGRIGKEVGKLAKAFGIKLLIYDRKKTGCSIISGMKVCDFEGVLKNSDIISLHCDANPTSIGMINADTIKKMKDGVVLINTARGSIINEKDLLKNIRKFSFVGLDVLGNEDTFSKKHPFLKYPNIFITPHIAYKSQETTQERWSLTYKYIDEFKI